MIVVVGKYTLSRLKLSSIESLSALIASTKSIATQDEYNSRGQILLSDLPNYLNSPDFGKVLATYLGKPITGDAVNQIVSDIGLFVEKHGDHLAAAEMPNQSVEAGFLTLGLKVGRFPIKHIITTDTIENAAKSHANNSAETVTAINNALYSTSEFKTYISKYIGMPLTISLIPEIRKDLVAYGKNHDRLIVETATPYLDVNTGEVRIAVIIGRYNQMHVKGNNWFSDALIEEKLGIKPGDEIKISELDNAVNWANQNPFRKVTVLLDTINQPVGIANLDISVNESRPVHFAASYSNAINSPLGSSSYTASSQFGNLWGLDHQLTYQYSTNNTPKYNQSHTFDYKAPLLWHDFLKVDLAYSMVNPHSLFGYVGLNEKAKNTVADISYIKPITKGLWSYQHSIGIDYKQVNTNLEFGTLVQPVATYDIAQLVLGETVVKKDTQGSWTLGINFNLSPGGLNSRDSALTYGYTSSGGATGRASLYEYGKLILERDNNIFWGFQWVSRGQLQLSSTNLQGSEQLLLGGGASVRGYSQSYEGDQGFIINEEIRSPYKAWRLPFTHSRNSLLNTQIVAFWDYGQVSYKHILPSDIKLPTLMGSGVGVRASILGYLSAGSDMSWPIFKPTYNDPHPTKGTFWISLTY
jgi:hemolysin activation/secretion protein